MKIWALIDNSFVVELISLEDDIIPGVDVFTPDIAANMIDATSVTGVARGWTYTNKQLSAPTAIDVPPPTVDELLAYASEKQNTILAQIWTFDVGTSHAPMKLTTKLDVAGQGAMMKLCLWGLLNASVGGATEPYSNIDYSTAALSPSQVTAMGTKAGAVVSATYGVLNDLASRIKAQTVTDKAAIDAAAWPTPA